MTGTENENTTQNTLPPSIFLIISIPLNSNEIVNQESNEHNRLILSDMANILNIVHNHTNQMNIRDLNIFFKTRKKKFRKKIRNILKQIKIFNYKEDMKIKECSICLNNFEVSEKLRELGCKHQFHKKCVETWIRNGNLMCPLCRSDLEKFLVDKVN